MQNQKPILWLAAFVVSVAVTGIAVRPYGASVVGAEREAASKATFLEHLKPGQVVSVEAKDGRYELGVFPKQIQPRSHAVIDIGRDYLVVRDIANVTDTIIPVYSISCIKVLRLGGKE